MIQHAHLRNKLFLFVKLYFRCDFRMMSIPCLIFFENNHLCVDRSQSISICCFFCVNKNVCICSMIKQFEKYKGIHPGIVLERDLKKRAFNQRPFALSFDEHYLTVNTITKG